MSFPEQTPYNVITATAGQTSFAYTFKVNAAADMAVYINGVEQGFGFTVNNVGELLGGTVDLAIGAAAGDKVALVANKAISRVDFDYQFQGSFSSDEVDLDFNARIQQMQQLKVLIDACLKNLPWSSNDGFDLGGKGFFNPKAPVLDDDLATKIYVDALVGNAIFDDALASAAALIGRTGPSLLFYHPGEVDASGNLLPVARMQPRASGGLEAYKTDGTSEAVLTTSDLDITITTGSFTPTWTGFSTDPTGDLFYTKIVKTDASGNEHGVVTLYQTALALQGVSNATGMTITGIPEAIRPAQPRNCPIETEDNGAFIESVGRIASSGTITFFAKEVSGSNIGYNNSGYTNSGNKGLRRTNMTYHI